MFPHRTGTSIPATQSRGSLPAESCLLSFCRLRLSALSPAMLTAKVGMNFKEDLKTEDLRHSFGEKLLIFNSYPGELFGMGLAYIATLNSSSSSLGFLGCLVFGVLYLREKQANASNVTALKDVQVHMQRAEAQLTTNTRSFISYKLEESQLGSGNERDNALLDAVKCQLCSIKSDNAEKGQKLTANKHALETLKQQAMSLISSIDELKRQCTSGAQQMDQHHSLRQALEAELKALRMDLQCKVDTVSELNIATEGQEQACNKLIEENAAAESPFNLMSEKVVTLQGELDSLSSSLVSSKDNFGFVSNELDIASARNVTLEAQLKELLRSLQHEQASFKKCLTEVNEQLISRKKMVDVHVSKLLSHQNDRDMELKTISQLTAERAALHKVIREKKDLAENVRKALSQALEERKILEPKLHTLCEQLQQEQAQNASLQSVCKGSTVSIELVELSARLEDELTAEKDLARKLKEEMHDFHEALRLSRRDLLELQDSMLSTLSGQSHLQDDLTRITEVQQKHHQALKKQKRAAAYAKRQLTQTSKILAQENQILEELETEAQSTHKYVEDLKLQIASCYDQFENSADTKAERAIGSLAPVPALKEEQSAHRDFNQSVEVPYHSPKPARRRASSNTSIPKLRG